MEALKKEHEFNSAFNSVWAQVNALYVRWANKHNIGYPEMMVLYALTTMGEMSQKEISDGFGLIKQTVNTVVRSLKKNGYITLKSNEKDKREKTVVLTEIGKQYCDEKIEPLLEAETRVYRKIGYERIKESQDTMELFNALFEKEIERK